MKGEDVDSIRPQTSMVVTGLRCRQIKSLSYSLEGALDEGPGSAEEVVEERDVHADLVLPGAAREDGQETVHAVARGEELLISSAESGAEDGRGVGQSSVLIQGSRKRLVPAGPLTVLGVVELRHILVTVLSPVVPGLHGLVRREEVPVGGGVDVDQSTSRGDRQRYPGVVGTDRVPPAYAVAVELHELLFLGGAVQWTEDEPVDAVPAVDLALHRQTLLLDRTERGRGGDAGERDDQSHLKEEEEHLLC